MNSRKQSYYGFGGYLAAESQTIRPESINGVIEAVKTFAKETILTHGTGNSYGDAALNENGVVLLTSRLNRILSFDEETGILRAEAGITLNDILTVSLPRGWSLSVVPGYSNNTLGGCVAFDIHSKNHWKEGSFSRHLAGLRIVLADGSLQECSRDLEPDLFWATVAGMGLTGIIIEVELRLRRIKIPLFKVHSIPVYNMGEIFTHFDNFSSKSEFAVAWIDLLNPGAFGRGVFITANYATSNILNGKAINEKPFSSNKSLSKFSLKHMAPFYNKFTNRLFNIAYFYKNAKTKHPFLLNLRPFLFPWDNIPHWNQLYGRKGFIEYQYVIPTVDAPDAFNSILDLIRARQHDFPVYFAAIKRMGPSEAPLSYPIDGYSMLLDYPMKEGLFEFLDEMDKIVLNYKGRVYLAKDGRVSSKMFHKMYPKLDQWLKVKNAFDPDKLFSSNMSRRLLIT